MSKLRIKELSELIVKARNDYYNDQPTVSDKVFDAWVDELRDLEPNHTAVTSVGAPIAPTVWQKAKHQIPMGSLDKVNTPDEFAKWVNDTCPNEDLFVCEKLDGLSVELIYENGKFVQGITRGDGEIGEDISSNVINMGGVQKTIKGSNFTGSLRGEIILTKSKHKKYFADKANPRNAASGVSKRLDGVGSEHLDVLLYQVLGDVDFETEEDQYIFLKKHGFKTPNYQTVVWGTNKQSADALVIEAWKAYQGPVRDNLDYDIDGLVIRISDFAKQMALGDKDLRPKGAKAFKFENEARESVIREIHWQVGNSGRLTPVAIVDPVSLVGATITRASIYNLAYIYALGIGVGAKVLVVRANDVIPRIEEVIKKPASLEKGPTHCPECNGAVVMDGENLVCTNSDDCPAQVKGRIKNWVSELNILELGTTLIDKMVDTKLIANVSDLYTLTVDQIASLDRMGDKSAKNVYESLWKINPITLDMFIGALSIPMIGSSSIRLLMDAGYDSLDKILNLTTSEIEDIKGMGPARADSLVKGLKKYKKVIRSLLDNGLKIKDKVIGSLTGKSFCFTGSMKNKRPVLEQMVVDAGGTVKSSVGKGLAYLVIDDVNSTSSKATAAKKIGTKLLSEDEFLRMAT